MKKYVIFLGIILLVLFCKPLTLKEADGMALSANRTTFEFNHIDQVDEYGVSIGDYTVVQANLDSRAKENLTDINNVKDTLRNDYASMTESKLDKNGDFKGTWNGMLPTASDPGLAATVNTHFSEYTRHLLDTTAHNIDDILVTLNVLLDKTSPKQELVFNYTPDDGSIQTGNSQTIVSIPKITFNKRFLLDILPSNVIKLYINETEMNTDTYPVPGVITNTTHEIIFTPTTTLSKGIKYYLRVFKGLQFSDGAELLSNTDFVFRVPVYVHNFSIDTNSDGICDNLYTNITGTLTPCVFSRDVVNYVSNPSSQKMDITNASESGYMQVSLSIGANVVGGQKYKIRAKVKVDSTGESGAEFIPIFRPSTTVGSKINIGKTDGFITVEGIYTVPIGDTAIDIHPRNMIKNAGETSIVNWDNLEIFSDDTLDSLPTAPQISTLFSNETTAKIKVETLSSAVPQPQYDVYVNSLLKEANVALGGNKSYNITGLSDTIREIVVKAVNSIGTTNSNTLAIPFKLTKDLNNPVYIRSNDLDTVRDATGILTADGTYNLIYTTWISGGVGGHIALATSNSRNGTYTKVGTILPTPPEGYQASSGDPHLIYDGNGKWYAFVSQAPTGGNLTKFGGRTIGCLIANGNENSIPMLSSWSYANPKIVMGKNYGWTSKGDGTIAGIYAMKVYPKTGGGWIGFLTSNYKVGYATAPSLDGEWTLFDTPLLGSDNYYAEEATYFTHNNKHYLLVNGLGKKSDYPNITMDLWVADSQTGEYKILYHDIFGRDDTASPNWMRGNIGVAGFFTPAALTRLTAGYDLGTTGTLEGMFDASDMSTLGQYSVGRDIGTFKIDLY